MRDMWEVPAACTLPVAGQPGRAAELDGLLALAGSRPERLGPGRLRLVLGPGPDGLLSEVRDFTVRESACCSFFRFDITELDGGRVRLDVGVPGPYEGVLDSIEARAAGS
jgi:hypothetical protein